jgi:Ser/Thr protein kinase RdoA (MazF antagonist)
MLTVLNSFPRDPQAYGLIHGDLHHGNFFDDHGRLVVFDFDAAHYMWFLADVANALYNCLPMPRSQSAKRRTFSVHYLTHLLRGYSLEKTVDRTWLERLPLFLKLCELLSYSYYHKYWDINQLSERRRSVLAEMRQRIENNVPVVAFEPEDLPAIQLQLPLPA